MVTWSSAFPSKYLGIHPCSSISSGQPSYLFFVLSFFRYWNKQTDRIQSELQQCSITLVRETFKRLQQKTSLCVCRFYSRWSSWSRWISVEETEVVTFSKVLWASTPFPPTNTQLSLKPSELMEELPSSAIRALASLVNLQHTPAHTLIHTNTHQNTLTRTNGAEEECVPQLCVSGCPHLSGPLVDLHHLNKTHENLVISRMLCRMDWRTLLSRRSICLLTFCWATTLMNRITVKRWCHLFSTIDIQHGRPGDSSEPPHNLLTAHFHIFTRSCHKWEFVSSSSRSYEEVEDDWRQWGEFWWATEFTEGLQRRIKVNGHCQQSNPTQ